MHASAGWVLQFSKSTLTDHGTGHHESQMVASAKRQLLTPEQEQSLVEWIKHQASMGLLLDRKELDAQASILAGRQVGPSWNKRFMKHHPDLLAVKGAQLDPKHAKNFHETVINHYFDMLEALHAHFPDCILAKHIWNMDKKGLQLGGGQKNLDKKFFHA